MESLTHLSIIPRRRRQGQSGVVLVIVLAMLVLITGLVVTLFEVVKGDAANSGLVADVSKADELTTLTIGLAKAQIIEATKGFEADAAGNPDLTRPLAWASQPGAIRTYRKDGSAHDVYKLYSSDVLVETSSNFQNVANPSTANPDLATDWASKPAQYTDLNEPVVDQSNNPVYPIAHPDAFIGADAVEGAAITNAPTAGTSNALPMPVQWLYVLADGRLSAPTSATAASGSTPSKVGGFEPSPTATNPIVGRIAFWADDETAKVNINTASEGSYWDVPRANTPEERAFAKNQPAQKEFQRYPGHPATVSLSTVFPTLEPDDIYSIVPRVNGGGSNGGTQVATSAVTPDNDRLYASVDELIFDQTSTRNQGFLSSADLERAKFFLTAQSRAPEVTLTNLPRVAIWPIDATDSNARRTAFDRLIAHCARINGFEYYFQRNDPKSLTGDYDNIPRNQQLYAYLQSLTSREIPGFTSTSFTTKYGADRNQILTQIFDYIRATNLDDSGLSELNRFSSRGEDTNAAGLQMGTSQVTPIRIGSTQGFGRFPAITEAAIHFICTAQWDDPATVGIDESQGSNIVLNKTLGGTLLTANQRRIEALFYFETTIPGQGWPYLRQSFTTRVRGLNNFQINGASLGFPGDAYDVLHQSSGTFTGSTAWGGSVSPRLLLIQGSLPARGVMPADSNAVNTRVYNYVSIPITIDASAGTMNFTGGTLTVDIFAGRNNSTLPTSPPGTPVQTYTFDFPNGTFPIPEIADQASVNALATGSTGSLPSKEKWWTFSSNGTGVPNGATGRLSFVNQSIQGGGGLVLSKDVLRSVVPSQDYADTRLIAANQTVPSHAFVPHPSYGSSTVNLAHSLAETNNTIFIKGYATDAANLVTGITWNNQQTPDIPIAHPNSNNNGDWDNGVATAYDGAYINKPDEGNTYNIASATPYFDDSHRYEDSGPTFFSPNRQIPSPVMFGSLPTGVNAGVPFQTLLFRPQSNHTKGNAAPADHLLLDLFWMPVVEPYAISEPLSTAGKLNMNTAIVPFTYIKRQTGLRAVLKAEEIMAIPNSSGSNYKSGSNVDMRKPIDVDETLTQFDNLFDNGEIFVSPSQITDLHLVPTGQTVAGMSTFWDSHKLTGDNTRERPYAVIYPRLTTKSNTFTVHYKVQALKKSPATSPDEWVEGTDKVVSEARGSETIERYIDPNDPDLPDFANLISTGANANANIDLYYRFRTINAKKFIP